MNRIIIPYNPKLKELARKLRRNMTFSEVTLWNEIKNGKLMGYDFDRQRPIGNFIVDFYCKDLKPAVEIDGITHEDGKALLKDKVRQEEMEILGVKFLRFDTLLVVNKVGAIVREIRIWIEEFEDKNGTSKSVLKRRSGELNPPLPLQGGDPSVGGKKVF